ncbi:MAG TPA: tyramine oxidase, partial [Streptosporangiaceae bacterium]|nr:tyramine oxidase [Streptosporangiaceae bacterium]
MTTQLADTPADGLAPEPAAHPLDPLSAQEIREAVAILKRSRELGETLRFVMISLHEPPKPPGLDFSRATIPDRAAFIVAYDRAEKMLYEAVVSLSRDELLSWTGVPGRLPSYLAEDMLAIEEIVRADPGWQEAMRKRGVTDFSLAMIDPWPSGYYGPQDHPATSPRLCRPLTWLRSAPREHGYARPVEGLVVTVDMDARTVVDVTDHGVLPVPPNPGNYAPEFMFDEANRPAFTGLRGDLKTISITQPDGPSFDVDGWAVTWQKWHLRVGFNPREGLVLHQ